MLTALSLVFGLAQIINSDREVHDAEHKADIAIKAQQQALVKLDESTTTIKDMTVLNTELQNRLVKQSDNITELAKENIADVTGGTSFCYIVAAPIEKEFMLDLRTIGKSPLHFVYVEMIDKDVLSGLVGKLGLTQKEMESFITDYPAVPFLSDTSARSLARTPMGETGKRSLHFNFFSMNGVWTEDLLLQNVNGRWEQALRVTKAAKNRKSWITMHQDITPNFPKVNGNVDWQ